MRLLRKERGRAAPFPSLTMETATRFRIGVNRGVKEALCAAVADEIRPGSTVVLDDSTTVFPLAALIARTEAVTVVTNSSVWPGCSTRHPGPMSPSSAAATGASSAPASAPTCCAPSAVSTPTSR